MCTDLSWFFLTSPVVGYLFSLEDWDFKPISQMFFCKQEDKRFIFSFVISSCFSFSGFFDLRSEIFLTVVLKYFFLDLLLLYVKYVKSLNTDGNANIPLPAMT